MVSEWLIGSKKRQQCKKKRKKIIGIFEQK